VFALGVLTVVGDGQPETIVIARDAAGAITVNGGAVPVVGGSPTVANTRSITLLGASGNDILTLDETNGALPQATVIGGSGDDTITGGSGGDLLIGQTGNDTLLGKGGTDRMFGGSGKDALTGGDADDQAFGESGDDRMIWNPGDDTDLNEGGGGNDTTEVNGGGGAEQFSATANGNRVRFDRINPAPFAVDMGTTEQLVLNANGGDDSFSATGDLAALVRITVDGGAGNDSLLGSNGIDVMLGGDGNDFLDGQQGNDVAFLGAGDDTFQWDPGDGSDVVEGQDGADAMLFNGSNAAELFDTSANGQRVRFFRDVANITMDMDDVESIKANLLGGADTLTVNDLSGTNVTKVAPNLAAPGGADDLQPDNVIANATNGDDVVTVTGSGTTARVAGLPAVVDISGARAGSDRLTVNALAGDDVVDASALAASALLLAVDGGAGNDVLIGGAGGDTLLGGADDDVLIGGPGLDTLDGGTGDNVVLDSIAANEVTAATAVGKKWLKARARTVKGKTVLRVNGEKHRLPKARLAKLTRGAGTF
jgi:Ca2+-binding RTX toxin-like protein